ncbi:MAG: diguanylate cyclase [Solirubrobacteraceae bacterium]
MSAHRASLPEDQPAREPADGAALPAGEPRESSGATIRGLLAYVEGARGAAARAEVIARAGMTGREADLDDEARWWSRELKLRLFRSAAEVVGDPEVPRRLGENAVEIGAQNAARIVLGALGSPRAIYSQVGRVCARFTATLRLEPLSVRRGTARIRARQAPGFEANVDECAFVAGMLTAAPRLFGAPAARVRHTRCEARGDEACLYEVAWDVERRWPRRLAVAAGGLGATGIVAAAALDPALLPEAAALAAGGLGGLLWNGQSAGRRERKRLEAEVERQAEAAGRLTLSLQDLVSGLALDDVVAKILANARWVLGGSEYLLLLDDGQGPRCQGAWHLPPDVVAAIETWAEARGAMSEPRIADELRGVPELELLPDHPDFPVGSLCSAPLRWRDESVGVIVALSPAPWAFLGVDLDLLAFYATQASVAVANARLYQEQQDRASRDALTGLLNHREFHERVNAEIERSRRHAGRFSVVLFDLDSFKLVNDLAGHAAGDRVLRQAGRALELCARASDVAFRLGGDEFALLLPETAADAARDVAKRAGSALAAIDSRTGASYGVAAWPSDGHAKDALLARADAGLYAMKWNGGHEPEEASPRSEEPDGDAEPDGRLALAAAAIQSAHQRERLSVASRLSARLAPLVEPGEICRATVEELHHSFDYHLADIHRLESEGLLRLAAGAGALMAELETGSAQVQPVTTGVRGLVARDGQRKLVRDTSRDPDFIGPASGDGGPGSELCVPIVVDGHLWGVLNLEQDHVDGFSADDVLLADTVAAQVGAAIHRSVLYGELEAAFTSTIAALSDALEANDAYTAAHAREVAELAARVAARVGMDAEQQRMLGYGALLHDIGKIALHPDILGKPGPLDPAELEQMRQHTVIGERLLARIPFFTGVHPLVRSAHERWDGHGYPDGLEGEGIPLGARVISACDAYHAMTSDRPYRRAMSRERAVRELREGSGSQFDPVVVRALLAELERPGR